MTSFQAPLYSNIDVLSGATILGNAKTDLSAYGIINHINIDYHQLLISKIQQKLCRLHTM